MTPQQVLGCVIGMIVFGAWLVIVILYGLIYDTIKIIPPTKKGK